MKASMKGHDDHWRSAPAWRTSPPLSSVLGKMHCHQWRCRADGDLSPARGLRETARQDVISPRLVVDLQTGLAGSP